MQPSSGSLLSMNTSGNLVWIVPPIASCPVLNEASLSVEYQSGGPFNGITKDKIGTTLNLQLRGTNFTADTNIVVSPSNSTAAFSIPKQRVDSATIMKFDLKTISASLTDATTYFNFSIKNCTTTTTGVSFPATNLSATRSLRVGDSHQGGTVFKLSGATSGKVISDRLGGSTHVEQWSIPSEDITNAGSVTDGKANTDAIMAWVNDAPTGSTRSAPAAALARTQGADWYLPAKDELLAALNALGTTRLDTSPYWSSTQLNNTLAYFVDFNTGRQWGEYNYNTRGVRAVRAY